jgi:hypothetical protein
MKALTFIFRHARHARCVDRDRASPLVPETPVGAATGALLPFPEEVLVGWKAFAMMPAE